MHFANIIRCDPTVNVCKYKHFWVISLTVACSMCHKYFDKFASRLAWKVTRNFTSSSCWVASRWVFFIAWINNHFSEWNETDSQLEASPLWQTLANFSVATLELALTLQFLINRLWLPEEMKMIVSAFNLRVDYDHQLSRRNLTLSLVRNLRIPFNGFSLTSSSFEPVLNSRDRISMLRFDW